MASSHLVGASTTPAVSSPAKLRHGALHNCVFAFPKPSQLRFQKPLVNRLPVSTMPKMRTEETPAAQNPKEEKTVVVVEEDIPWIQEKALDLVEFTGSVSQPLPGPRVCVSSLPWVLAVPMAYFGITFVNTVRKFNSPKEKRKKLVSLNFKRVDLAMGLFKWLGGTRQNMDSFSKAMCDEISDQSCSRKPHSCSDLRDTSECDCNSTDESSALDSTYSSWVKKHPSALSMFDRMMSAAKGKRIVVFLDYDGTLSPIVDNPDQAFMSDAMRSAVREVARYFPTAIISGRSRDKVCEFVQLTSVYYAGSHGMDILAPMRPLRTDDSKYQTRVVDNQGNEVVLFQPAQEFLPAITEILKVMEEKTKKIFGVIIENNRFCISVHFRRVHKEDFGKVEEVVKSVLKDYPHFHLTRGRKVMEIRPSIKWDKGHALEYLLDTLGFGTSSDVVPLYIGDDRTDEDAFKVLQNRKQGYPIIVSSIPKETKASYSLKDPSEVMCFLLRLVRWRINSSSGSLVI